MAQFVYEQLINSASFGANTSEQTKIIKLPRTNWLRRIKLNGKISVDAAGTSPNNATIQRLLKNIEVKANGNASLVSVSGEDLAQINLREYKTNENIMPNGIQSTTTYYFSWIIDFAVNMSNSNDLSALVPAQNFTSFDLILNTNRTTIAAGNSDTTLTSFDVNVVLDEVYMTDNEAEAMYGGKNYPKLLKVLIAQFEGSIDTAHSNYSGTIPIMPGYVITKLLLRTSDTADLTAVSKNDLVSSYKLYQHTTAGNFTWDMQDWRSSQLQDVLEHNLNDVKDITGSIQYDATGSLGGLDARNMSPTDLSIKYNNTDTEFSYHLTEVYVVVPQ